MSEETINLTLDALIFVLVSLKMVLSDIDDFGFMTRLGLFLGSGWLLSDDLNIIPIAAGYARYSITRTGVFKASLLIGLLLDIVRYLLKRKSVKGIK